MIILENEIFGAYELCWIICLTIYKKSQFNDPVIPCV